jgi:hypothetical protein
MADKILVETTGDFMLMDGTTGCDIEAHRPTVVTQSGFTHVRIAISQLRVLAKLKPEATDVELQKYIAEAKGDMELAVESFKSKFEIVDKLTRKKDKPFVPDETFGG